MKPRFCYYLVKRLFDILAAGFGIVVTSPIWLITVIGIKVSDAGPIFYFANRVGKNNKTFRMLKFRSMRVEENADEKSLRPDQDRIFPFGRFIRAAKIDELPQLLNVLLGNMAVVGPRPAATDQIQITRGGKNGIVSTVKTGLTSPAALYDYLYGDSIEDEDEYMEKVTPTRLALDRYYVDRQSIRYDIKLIWYTIRCIWGTVTKNLPVKILEELLDAVDGDRRALDEVKVKK
ncbi:sugar transferase [Sporofaciens musculi]|jgi:O-antigen biosynthesis protein WbqP|uniref:sugar transferase n=1 Tax=Sporofaciens musculi TaxID=2681861 RepID=UPI00257068D8|nr:sugar transferase [Sporofaciens musculi]